MRTPALAKWLIGGAFLVSGCPLRTYETIVSLIANATDRGGLVVRARLDKRRCSIGKTVPNREFAKIRIEHDDWHGDWDYVIKPRSYEPR